MLFIVILTVVVLTQSQNVFEELHNQKLKDLPFEALDYHPEDTLFFRLPETSVTDNLLVFLNSLITQVDGQLVLIQYIVDYEHPVGDSYATDFNYYVAGNMDEFLPEFFINDRFSETDPGDRFNRLSDRAVGLHSLEDFFLFSLTDFTKQADPSDSVLSFYLISDSPDEIMEIIADSPVPIPMIGPAENNQLRQFFDEVSSFVPYGQIIFLLFAIFCLIMITHTSLVVSNNREVSIRKLHGQTDLFVFKKLYLYLNMELLIVFGLTFIITLMLNVKYWNPLTGRYLRWLGLFVIFFLVSVLLANVVTYWSIRKNNPVRQLKQTQQLDYLMRIGVILKVGIAVLIASQLFSALPSLRQYFDIRAAEKFYHSRYIEVYTGDHFFSKDLPQADRRKLVNQTTFALEDAMIEIDSLGVKYYEEGMHIISGVNSKGEPILKQMTQDVVIATHMLLNESEIIDTSGKRIQFTETPSVTTMLLPIGKELENTELFGQQLPKPGITIDIPAGQGLLTPNGEFIHNPILLIVSTDDLWKVSESYFLDTPDNRAQLSAFMSEAGVDQSAYAFRKIPENLSKPLIIKDLKRIGLVFILTFASFLMSTLYLVQLYIESKAKLLVLRYINGNGIARQHRELFYTVLLPYTIGFLLVAVMPNVFAEMYKAQNSGFYVTQPEISLIRVGLIFLSLLFIDVVLHWAFVSYLKKHSVGALKGEF